MAHSGGLQLLLAWPPLDQDGTNSTHQVTQESDCKAHCCQGLPCSTLLSEPLIVLITCSSTRVRASQSRCSRAGRLGSDMDYGKCHVHHQPMLWIAFLALLYCSVTMLQATPLAHTWRARWATKSAPIAGRATIAPLQWVQAGKQR